MLALLLSVVILPTITLANISDRISDRLVGKPTASVLFGNRRAAILSGIMALIAVVLVDGLWLCWLIRRFVRRGARDGRLDGLMITALTCMVWFAMVPLIHLIHQWL